VGRPLSDEVSDAEVAVDIARRKIANGRPGVRNETVH
jgi:hypothetical protein